MKVLVRMRGRGCRLRHCHSQRPLIVSDNSDHLLLLPAETKLGCGEQAVGNQEILVDMIVDELRLAVLTDDE
jgi:hypothetical protein